LATAKNRRKTKPFPAIMKTERRDIFNELEMDKFIWGNAFLFTIENIDMSIENNRFSILDNI